MLQLLCGQMTRHRHRRGVVSVSSDATSSSSSVACENTLKPYAMKFRQLTKPQLVEILDFLQGHDTVQIQASKLGFETEKYKMALKGKHTSWKNSNKKEDWEQMVKGFRTTWVNRCRKLVLKMLDAKDGQLFRRDSSISFGKLLKQWKLKWDKRYQKERKLGNDVRELYEALKEDAINEKRSVEKQHPWLKGLIGYKNRSGSSGSSTGCTSASSSSSICGGGGSSSKEKQ